MDQSLKHDSLLKLFSSEYFTTEMLLQYYYKSFSKSGVHDYLTNKLYTLDENQLSFYVPQLCYLLIKNESAPLEKFIIDVSARKFALFLKIYWCLHAYSTQDRLGNKKKSMRIDKIQRCMEMSMVNKSITEEEILKKDNIGMLKHFEEKQHRFNYFANVQKFVGTLIKFSLTLKQFPREDRRQHLKMFLLQINQSLHQEGIIMPIYVLQEEQHSSNMVVNIVEQNFACFHTKKRVPYLIFAETIKYQKIIQQCKYEEDLQNFQPLPFAPLSQLNNEEYESPLNDEGLQLQMAQIVKEEQKKYHDALEKIMKMELKGKRQSQIMKKIGDIVQKQKENEERKTNSNSKQQQQQQQTEEESSPTKTISPIRLPQRRKVRIVYSCIEFEISKQEDQKLEEQLHQEAKKKQRSLSLNSRKYSRRRIQEFHDQLIVQYPNKEFFFRNQLVVCFQKRNARTNEIWDEVSPILKFQVIQTWEERLQILRKQSLFGHFPSYKLRPIIIKGGDDLRQELLAIQMMTKFQNIFEQAKLRLYLRPYNILVTSANSGIVEYIPNTISIDSLKKKFGEGTKTLYQIYKDLFGNLFEEAQKNFIESLAGYSLFTYLLQVKDRHNGNIMIDDKGHIIHIDFGFILSSSPGGVNFESAPFKLTQEYVELMKGKDSDFFGYFRTLMLRGLMELKRYVNDLQYLLIIMSEQSDLPCFQNFDIKQWRSRFLDQSTDKEVTFQNKQNNFSVWK